MDLIQQSSNYKSFDTALSKLRYTKMPISNLNNSSVTLGLTTSQQLQWKLPGNTPYNLAKSYFTYQYTIPGSTGNYGVVQEVNQDFASAISFTDGASASLCDVQNADRYTSVIGPLRTTQQELLTRDQMETLYNTNQTNTNNVLPFPVDGLIAGTTNTSSQSYLEPQYLRFSSAADTAMTVSRMVPLSVFKDTYVGMDRLSIFPKEMYLNVNTIQGNKIGFYVPTANIAAPNVNVIVELGTAPTLINVNLYLAVEQNEAIINSLRQYLSSGSIKYQIPYTYVYRMPSTGVSANLSITINNVFGKKLKRLIYAPFSPVEKNGEAFNHSNVNGSKCTTVLAQLDSKSLTDTALNCFNPNNPVLPTGCGFTVAGTTQWGDDWKEMRELLRGSCIDNYSVYQTNWSYAIVFGMRNLINDLNQNISDNNINDGFPLENGVSHQFVLQLNTPCITQNNTVTNANSNSLIHYIFQLTEKEIAVGPNGIIFLA